MRRRSLLVAATVPLAVAAAAAEPLRLAAAGSLRAVLAEIAVAFAAMPGGAPVAQTYGPSGMMRQRIIDGGAFDVFASANMEHPRRSAWSPGGSHRPSPTTGSAP